MELSLRDISGYFREDNILSALVKDYIYRPNQAELAERIYSAFIDKEFLVAEAGTGVGKTYAYLIPAILWASDEKEQVVISTRTKALQEQLVEKDIPNITEALKVSIRTIEAKGRENYLCWNKYMQILAGKRPMNQAETKFIEKILTWAERTKTGDKKELLLRSNLMENWWIVAADRKSCLKDTCPYQDKCFRLKMIRSLDKADIIVVNHALLLSDITVDNSILPSYKFLILDEAHHLDQEAFTRLSNRVSFNELRELLKSFSNRNLNKGYLLRLKKELPQEVEVIEEAVLLTDRVTVLLSNLQSELKNSLKSNYNDQRTTIISPQIIENEFHRIFDIYFELIEILNRLVYQIKSLKVEEADFIALVNSLTEISDKLFKIMEEDLSSQENLAWAEWQDGEVETLFSSIINIGEILNKQLYTKLDSLIMLSATMTIDEKFDFFIHKTGLTFVQDKDILQTFIGKSPFSYEKQARMLNLIDLPPPNSHIYTEEITNALKEIISITKGQTLILFTARKQMLACARLLRPFCAAHHLELLVQNEDGEASHIINSFMVKGNSILMGLDSFWEGIDLKGDILTCLVIVKLPFRAPSEPFASAYDKYYRNQGSNSFLNFALPDAVMRFKQGIGRLIRSEKDQGVVIVLDNRLYTKRYGESFKKSIPIKNIFNIEKNQLTMYLK